MPIEQFNPVSPLDCVVQTAWRPSAAARAAARVPVRSRYASSIEAISTFGEKWFRTSKTLRDISR